MSEAGTQRDRRLMHRTAALLSEDYPLDQLFERLCDAVCSELSARIAFIAMSDAAGALKVAASAAADPAALADVSARSSAHAAFHGGAAIFDRGRDLAVPIVYRERTLGVLVVVGTGDPVYDEADQRMLTAIARYLAIAIRNQRIPMLVTRGLTFARIATVAIAGAAAVLSVMIVLFAFARGQQAERSARELARGQLRGLVSEINDYLLNAEQLSASLTAVMGGVRQDRGRIESGLREMLQSARTPEIYGMGIWFAPYAFDGRTRLYGPYVHWSPSRKPLLTYDWMRASYDFHMQPWYQDGLKGNGRVVFTKPYFDTDHVYITAARAFYGTDGKPAGVTSVDSIVPTLEGSLHLGTSRNLFASVQAADGQVLLTSDDADLLAFARRTQKVAGILAVPAGVVARFQVDQLGADPILFAQSLSRANWRVTLAVSRSALQAESSRLMSIAIVAAIGIWVVAALAIVVVMRSRRAVERANALEVQHRALETEIAERVRAEERLREYAYRDELTGLPNRAFIIQQIANAMQRIRSTESENLAILFIDIDRFNLINDSLGHATGDLLLTAFGTRLSRHAKAGDVIARLGGDEYVMLIGIQSEADARARAAAILQSLRHPFVVSGHEFFVSASIGIAIGESRYESPEELLRDADAAMYEAKRAGRATFRRFDRSMHDDALEILELETELRRGLQRGEIVAEFQPIVALADGSIVGFEALARWNHPTRGRVMPDTFIKIAEQSGLIVDIDECIVAQACDCVREWSREYPGIFVAVNASAAHLARVDDLAIVRNAIKESGVSPQSIKVEITESAVMENQEKSLAVLHSLRDLGVRVVIDDFGTGYSSLSHLQSLPSEELKIDRSFISAMLRDEKAAEIVRAILGISKTLHLRVTAEGIESEEQANRLHRFGIEFGQGYYFGKAAAPEMVGRLLRTRLKRTVGA